jgi:hypothetical protein
MEYLLLFHGNNRNFSSLLRHKYIVGLSFWVRHLTYIRCKHKLHNSEYKVEKLYKSFTWNDDWRSGKDLVVFVIIILKYVLSVGRQFTYV